MENQKITRKGTPAYWRMPRTMTQSALICTWGPRKVVRPCGERRTHRSGEGCPLGSARLKRRLRPTKKRVCPCQAKVFLFTQLSRLPRRKPDNRLSYPGRIKTKREQTHITGQSPAMRSALCSLLVMWVGRISAAARLTVYSVIAIFSFLFTGFRISPPWQDCKKICGALAKIVINVQNVYGIFIRKIREIRNLWKKE